MRNILGHKLHQNAGFSLIELSIVVIVIGVIAISIMAGRTLLEAAEMRAVITDIETYKTSVNSFKDIYGTLPGDYRHADSTWSCGASCNGNGNGLIDQDIGWKKGMLEGLRAWQHLYLAKLITGNYNGVEVGGAVVPGTNAPISSVEGSAYIIGVEYLGIENVFDEPGNYFVFGSAAKTVLAGPALSVEETYSLDMKIDDGKAFKGGIRSSTGWQDAPTWELVDPPCIQNYGGRWDYNFDAGSAKACQMSFWLL